MSTPETPLITSIFNDVELTTFERFVESFSGFHTLLQEYAFVGVFVSGVFVVAAWFIFKYHEHKIQNYDFFAEHIDVVGRFTKKTYDMFRWWSRTFPPMAMFIVAYSICTRFNTVSFIETFGTRHVKSD